MTYPLLSVVIPTYNRPDFLRRSIDSALLAAPSGDVEVLVVPNGGGTGWKEIKKVFESEARVHWFPIPQANVCAARNQGLVMASGRFIRFLDDDDYLYAAGAIRQCQLLLDTGADCCSGTFSVVRSDGKFLKSLTQPRVGDLTEAVLCPRRRPHPLAYVFRRAAILDIRWNESMTLNEDTDWLVRIILSGELSWVTLIEPVGAWVQHLGARLSRGRDPGDGALKGMAENFLDAANILERDGRLGPSRKRAVADALWSLLQKGLRYDYAYWRKVAAIANGYAAGRTPPSRIYRYGFVRYFDPLLIESLLIPVRWAYHPLRKVLERFGINRA